MPRWCWTPNNGCVPVSLMGDRVDKAAGNIIIVLLARAFAAEEVYRFG